MSHSPRVDFFAKFIEKELGIVYSEFNLYQLQNRLEEIVRILALADVEALYQKSAAGMTNEVKQLLLDHATNNETSFFRDPKLFAGIGAQILPGLAAKARAGQRVRIWSAACSFGQEPYTIAMMIRELGLTVEAAGMFDIRATDIAARVLDRARKGRFTQLEVQRGLSAPLMVKYFAPDTESYWSVKPELAALVRFEKQNLLARFEDAGPFDMIFCRNVLIYQNVENKKKIINRLRDALVPGGFLAMGAGESLIGLSEAFEIARVGEAIVYKNKGDAGSLAA